MEDNVFVIGEIGINSNGDIKIAKQLIEGAKEAGANAVKFQKRSLEHCFSREALNKPAKDNPWGCKTYREYKERLEHDKRDYDTMVAYCKALEIEFMASAWDLPSVEFLKQYDLNYNKIASPMLIHKELLNAVAEQKKYTFISTGMSTTNEIQEAVYIFRKHECPFELMHCCSTYPMELEDANLRCIEMLKRTYSCKVGFSDHYPGIITSVIAVALGATSIEKHITLSRANYGSDQASSVELVGFERMIKYIRAVDKTFGDGIKKITNEEEVIKNKLQRRIDY